MLDRDLENSMITKIMREGMPDNRDLLVCPMCNAEVDELAFNQDGEIIGCRECIEWKEAWEVERGTI